MNLLGDYMEHMRHQDENLQPSWATQLDRNGMQPHSREHLENELTQARSTRKYQMVEGAMMDYCPGIQFSGRP